MARMAKGTITFYYNMDEDPYIEMFEEEASDEEKMQYFRETMAEDVVQMSYDWPELPMAIEMEIVEDVNEKELYRTVVEVGNDVY
jgi:hypothetical protein